MSRTEKLEAVLAEQKFPLFHGRPGALTAQLARIAEVGHSTIRYSLLAGKVRSYEMEGAVLLLDVLDLIEHLRTAHPGRKSLQRNAA